MSKPLLGWQRYSGIASSLSRSFAYLPWNKVSTLKIVHLFIYGVFNHQFLQNSTLLTYISKRFLITITIKYYFLQANLEENSLVLAYNNNYWGRKILQQIRLNAVSDGILIRIQICDGGRSGGLFWQRKNQHSQ